MFRHLHQKVVENLSSRSTMIILLYCSTILLFLGWLDVVTGDYSLIVFYLIPVSLAAWFVSRNYGLLFCLLTALVRFSVDEWLSSSPFDHTILHYWNEFIEFLFLIIMSLLFSALKNNFEREKELARRDPLTNTLNRRSFFDLAEHEMNRARRYNLPLTIAYIDVDNFKVVNDQQGHHAGDELLLMVVSTIHSNIRTSDILARFGGDEFVVLLPETPADAALKFLRKIQENLDRSMAQKNWAVSFSIGAVTHITMPLTVDDMIRNADELMYSVKRAGKNNLLHQEIGGETHG